MRQRERGVDVCNYSVSQTLCFHCMCWLAYGLSSSAYRMSATVSLDCACSSAVGCMSLSEIAARITAIVHKAQTRIVKIMVFFFIELSFLCLTFIWFQSCKGRTFFWTKTKSEYKNVTFIEKWHYFYRKVTFQRAPYPYLPLFQWENGGKPVRVKRSLVCNEKKASLHSKEGLFYRQRSLV